MVPKDLPPLTAENQQLLVAYTGGIRRALTSDAMHALESPHEIGGNPPRKHLQRVVFLRDQKDEDRFRVSLSLRGHRLNRNKTLRRTAAETAALPLVWPDCVDVTLVDNLTNNIRQDLITFQDKKGRAESTLAGWPGFKSHPLKGTNYIAYDGVAIGAYGIVGSVDGMKDGYTPLDYARIVTHVLEHGRTDQEAEQRMTELLTNPENGELLDGNFQVVLRSNPYFRRILDTCLAPEVVGSRFRKEQLLDR